MAALNPLPGSATAPGTDDARAAAIMLAALGEDAGAAVMAYFNAAEIRRASLALRALGEVAQDEISAVMARYRTVAARVSGLAAAASATLDSTLVRALGAARAGSLRREFAAPTLAALSELAWEPPGKLAARLETLPPQAQAVVAAQLPQEVALAVLDALPERVRGELLLRLAESTQPSADALAELDAWLAAPAPDAQTGEAACARLLRAMGQGSANRVLSHVAEADAPLAARLASRTLRFDDLATQPLALRRAFLQRVSARTLLHALKAAPPRLVEVVQAALSPTAAARLRDDLDSQGQVAIADIEAAQDAALVILRELVADPSPIEVAPGESVPSASHRAPREADAA